MVNNNSKAPRVLLVDDDTALLRSLARVLEEHGLQIDTTTCAAEASAFLGHYTFDAIVCDQNMPGKSGLEFLTEVREKHPGLVIMILSGQIEGIRIAEDWAKEIGVYQMFSKPTDGAEIAAAIQRALRTSHASAASK